MKYVTFNKMIKQFFIGLIVFCAATSYGQTSKFVESDSIIGQYSQFSVDNFDRIYLCKEDVIQQHYLQNDSVFTASLKSFRPTSIESSKSFRTLLFDQERSVIHFYDNTLTDIHGEIDLVSVGIQQPILVCESFVGNAFWVLDGGLMRLVKLNKELEIISQTENLYTLFDNDELPVQMLEYNDFLYVLIPNKGVAIFDVFGTFIKIYPTKATYIGALNNYLLVQTNNKIEAISNSAFLFADFTYTIPNDVNQFMFSNQKVYLLKNNKLLIGAFKER